MVAPYRFKVHTNDEYFSNLAVPTHGHMKT